MKIQETQNNKPSPLRTAAGITTGAAICVAPTAVMITKAMMPLSESGINKKREFISKFITEIDSYENIKKIADKILLKPEISAKKIKLEIVNPENIEKINPLPKKKPTTLNQKISYRLKDYTNKIFANGLNACFHPRRNSAWISDKGLYSAVFHELGHAITFNSKSTKPLMILRSICQLTTLIFPIVPLTLLGIGALDSHRKPKKQKNEVKEKEPKTISKFVHDNAGKLTFLWFTPVVIEEALASLRGFKMANEYLTKNQQKIHIKNQALALCSYIFTGGLTSGAVALGIAANDKIIKHKKTN